MSAFSALCCALVVGDLTSREDGLLTRLGKALLELVARSAGNPQVILLTADEEVASWARLEALTGELAVLEPTPDAAPAAPPAPARANGVA